jgi:hypothetical protein
MQTTALTPQKNTLVLMAIDALCSMGINNPSIREIKSYISGLQTADRLRKKVAKK